jgi:PST family polysaccharide transporter
MAKYGSMFVQLGLTMILSRLILPEAYGVVAIITILIGFLNLFSDMGLGINIIQHPEMSIDNVNRLFSFSMIIGIVLTLATILASIPLSSFYENSVYYHLCPIVSVASFFNAVNVVPNAILTRDKKFKLIALRTIICSLISGVIAVILAWYGLGVYALISQFLISSLFLFIWNYANNPLKIVRFKFSKVIHLLGSYSLFQILFNFLNYFTRNLDHLLIGKFFGAAGLAQYNKSYFLYLYPNNIFASVLTGVLHPYIREYKTSPSKMLEKYIQIEKILSIIGVFTMISFFFCSREIVLIMFGDNWEPAGEYLRCLSICMWAQMMCSVAGSIFLGMERTDQTFKCGVINLILLVVSIFIGVYFDSLLLLSLLVGVSYNIIFFVTNYILVVKILNNSLWFFLSKISVDGIFAFLFVILSLFVPSLSENIFVSLIVKLLICIVAYSGYLFFTRQWQILTSLTPMFTKAD